MNSLTFNTTTIARRGLRDDVHDSILELLLRGDTEPGTRLSIDTIARQLGVSPTPVREALVQLERTGLVTREALKGYRVAPPLGAEQITELVRAREMLEGTAALLAGSSTTELLPELRAAHERHRAAGEAIMSAMDDDHDDVALSAEYYARDQDFHRVIFRHCGNRYLSEMKDNLGAQLHRLRQIVNRGVTDVQEAIGEHEAIIAAFETGDPQQAQRAMEQHIRNVLVRSLRDEQ
ncbi:GntR family transcriptional regulator [Microbacterium paludicola]|uniref:GntR family transcriptional regulator n=1 Tax=Microbacterium paludicola TaxID=300019 RepID=UPI0021B56C4D|nr:GntR family transcriptional regulator [Microbacterium paludicola]